MMAGILTSAIQTQGRPEGNLQERFMDTLPSLRCQPAVVSQTKLSVLFVGALRTDLDSEQPWQVLTCSLQLLAGVITQLRVLRSEPDTQGPGIGVLVQREMEDRPFPIGH
jgi:hypothetical protein